METRNTPHVNLDCFRTNTRKHHDSRSLSMFDDNTYSKESDCELRRQGSCRSRLREGPYLLQHPIHNCLKSAVQDGGER
eukprot:scaffold208534_cov30-Tisochrysis_lutea.AAC.2